MISLEPTPVQSIQGHHLALAVGPQASPCVPYCALSPPFRPFRPSNLSATISAALCIRFPPRFPRFSNRRPTVRLKRGRIPSLPGRKRRSHTPGRQNTRHCPAPAIDCFTRRASRVTRISKPISGSIVSTLFAIPFGMGIARVTRPGRDPRALNSVPVQPTSVHSLIIRRKRPTMHRTKPFRPSNRSGAMGQKLIPIMPPTTKALMSGLFSPGRTAASILSNCRRTVPTSI